MNNQVNSGTSLSRTDYVALAAVAGWAVLLRVLFLLSCRDHIFFQIPIMDMSYHDEWARRVAAGDFWGREAFFRAPLYPYFLALLYKLSSSDIFFARYIQAGIGGVSAALTYLLGRTAFSRRVGLLGALTWGTLWTGIYYDVELLLAVLEIPLNLAFLYFTYRAAKSYGPAPAVLAGLFLALSALTRPNILAVGVLIWVAFLVRAPEWVPFNGRRAVRALVFLYGTAAVCIAPVTVRNYVVGGEPVLIAWQGGPNLWIGNNPSADGHSAVAPGTRWEWWRGHHDMVRQAEAEVGRKLTPGELDRHFTRKAVRFMFERPAAAGVLFLRKVYYLVNAYELPNNFDDYYFKDTFPVLRYNPVSLYVVLPLALYGFGVVGGERRRLVVIYLFVVVYAATLVLFFVNGRFRMPLTPVLCIMAATAFFRLWEGVKTWPRRKVSGHAAILVVLLLACAADPWHIAQKEVYRAQARYAIGTLYARRADWERAEKEYRAALALDRTVIGVAALNELGIVAARRGDAAAAASYFSQAIAVDPHYGKAWNNLGTLARDAGDAAAARRYYEEAVKADPGDGRAHYFLGKLDVAEGDLGAAEKQFLTAVAKEPTFGPAWLELGRLAQARGDNARAKECYTTAVYHVPDAWSARQALADVNMALGDYAEAMRQYRLVLKYRESPRNRYNLACALARLGRPAEAVAELERAIEQDPERYKRLAAGDEDLVSLRGRDDFRGLLGPP